MSDPSETSLLPLRTSLIATSQMSLQSLRRGFDQMTLTVPCPEGRGGGVGSFIRDDIDKVLPQPCFKTVSVYLFTINCLKLANNFSFPFKRYNPSIILQPGLLVLKSSILNQFRPDILVI